ncbi:MAG: hypothetical protein WCD69_06900 [Xanthobacteraceae bacterium]
MVRPRKRETGVFAPSDAFGIILSLLRIPLILPLVLPLLADTSAIAQTPVTGFVPPYEIVRTVRAAGFDPLAPPLREGTTYVLRATDFRGILMRVVVDARTGAIRDANRIVAGPGLYGGGYPSGTYGPAGYGPGGYDPAGYGSEPYGPRPYGPDTSRPPGMAPPTGGEASADAMPSSTETPQPRIGTSGALPAEADALGEPQQPSGRAAIGPPLPRPRPAALVAAKRSHDPAAATSGVSNGKPGPAQPDVASTATMAPSKLRSAKPGKASSLPAIND